MRVLILIAITAALGACNNGNKSHLEQTFNLPKSEYVILPFDTAWHWIFKNAKQAELSEAELSEIEKLMTFAVDENNKEQQRALAQHNQNHPNDLWKETGYELKLNGSKRQYIAVTNNKGEKEIWINLFCGGSGNGHWRSDILIVSDGGNCYFNLKVNLTNKTFSELSINGYA